MTAALRFGGLKRRSGLGPVDFHQQVLSFTPSRPTVFSTCCNEPFHPFDIDGFLARGYGLSMTRSG
jgi:hypothetical protein